MALDRPVHAAETADGTAAPAVAAPGAPASVARAATLVQTPPVYRFFVLGGKRVVR